MSTNMQRLGSTLANRMKRTANGAVPTTIELARVNEDLSITTDSLQTPIPKGDYMVNLMLSGSFEIDAGSHIHADGTHGGHADGDGSHTHDGGEHSHSIRGIEPGDRVLVAWCGYEPVVIAVVVSS